MTPRPAAAGDGAPVHGGPPAGYEHPVTSTSRTSPVTLANALTALRIALVPVIVVLLLVDSQAADLWALVLFVVASITDTADGYFARRQSGVSRWGKLADPIADKLLVIGTLATLALRGDVAWWIVGIIALREAAVTVQRQVLLRHDIVMSASQWGKIKAAAQMVAIPLVIAVPLVNATVAQWVLWAAVALTVATGIDYAVRGARRARAAR